MTTIKHNNITWIDIENPSAQDVLFLKEKFNFHPLVLEELTSPSQRPRAEEFENCLYIVIHVPLYDKKKKASYPGELDMIVTKNHLITSHVEENIPVKSIIRLLKRDIQTKEKAMSKTSGFFLYFVMEKLISSCFPKIDHIDKKIDFIEKSIFDKKEKKMLKEISIVKRDVLNLRRTLKPQRSILESLLQKKYVLLENELNNYFQDLIGTNIRVWNAIENTKEVIESLEETNNSLVSHKINEVMRFIAAISLITFSLSVTTGIFSMIPFAEFYSGNNPAIFWLVLLFMGLIVTTLLFIFKRKNWF